MKKVRHFARFCLKLKTTEMWDGEGDDEDPDMDDMDEMDDMDDMDDMDEEE